MKIYEIEFMQYTNGMRDAVYSEKYDKYIKINKEGFVAKESDIDYLKEFGKGFKKLRFIGELFNDNFNDNQDKLTINISCNLIGKEDVEKTIEELQNKLNSLKVNLTV